MNLLIKISIFFFLVSCESLFFDDYTIKTFNRVKEPSSSFYTVKKGDNLYLISKKYNVTIQKIINFNNIDFPYKIYPNQKIFIPRERIHIVSKGETLYSISRKYKTDIFSIRKFNKLKNTNIIEINQKLVIPENNKKISKKKKFKAKKIDKKKKIAAKTKKKINIPKSNYKEKFAWPVKGKIILKFGSSSPGLFNDGINISSSSGAKVRASGDGEIVYSGNEIPGYGNLILIRHSKNWITAYAHLDKILIKKGSFVKKGDHIGSVGSSGNVQNPQLHFEIRKGKEAVDPLKYLS